MWNPVQLVSFAENNEVIHKAIWLGVSLASLILIGHKISNRGLFFPKWN
jgi:hypothetical protein